MTGREVSVERGPGDGASGSIWRVIAVDLPAGGARGAEGAFPGGRVPDDLPGTVRVTGSEADARDTLERLRRAGVRAILVEEAPGSAVFCADHDARLAHERCRVCARAICPQCLANAGGRPLCRTHRDEEHERSQWTLMRQAFVAMAGLLLLYQVLGPLVADTRAVASGEFLVGVLQFVPPGLEGSPLVRRLNGLDSGESLQDLEHWFGSEYRRYTGRSTAWFRLEVHGPYVQGLDPPSLARDPGDVVGVALHSLAYVRYWRGLARQRGVQLSAFNARVFVVYHSGEGDAAAHSRGSSKGRLAVAHVDVEDANPAYTLITVAHELAHTLGATDKYGEDDFLAEYPEGLVEPFRQPLYPQRFAELMAVDVPLGPDLEVEPRSLDKVRIGHRTAAELGWVTPSSADAWYELQGRDAEDALAPSGG